MKKTLMGLVAIAVTFILTGCGTETLTCTMNQSQSGMEMNQKAVITFENNEVTKIDMNVDVNVDDAFSSYMSFMESALKEQFKNYSDNGAKVNIDTKGNKMSLKVNMDVKGMTKEQKKNLDLEDVYGTKEATKKELESQGYTCK